MMNYRPRIIRNCLGFLLAFCLLLFCAMAFAQTHSSPQVQAQHSPATPVPAAQHGTPPAPSGNAESGREFSAQTSPSEVEEEENAQFKHSKAVVWISSKLGLSAGAGFWIFTCINFAIIAGFLYWVSHTNLVQAMRDRTATIQRGIEEARKASAEADARLREVQERLAKLDLEVAQIRGSADADFVAEEQRIRQAAEEDAQRVVEQAKSEIEAMSKSARRELKTYAAELAVELARKNINVDPQTDAALVRSFASELGKDGK
jgi:F-type H+-transporting ATPase subunit b